MAFDDTLLVGFWLNIGIQVCSVCSVDILNSISLCLCELFWWVVICFGVNSLRVVE